jgi:palmitoyltransferase ZDHHC13/17
LKMGEHDGNKDDAALKDDRRLKLDSLITAVRFGIQSQVMDILNENEFPDIVNDMDSQGHTSVHWACKKGDVEMLYLLHNKGAKLDVKTREGAQMYPIHWAASEGKISALRFMVEQGQDLNVQDANGCSPVILAVQYKHADAVVFLWKHGADMTTTDSNGDTAHHWAAYKGWAEILALLHYIDPHQITKEDRYGQSAIHLAALRGNDDVLEVLLKECHVDLTIRDRRGDSPLDLAIKKNHLNCELILRRAMPGATFYSLVKALGFKRLREGKVFGSVFCAANEVEMTKWPWRVVFWSNFIASCITLNNMMNPELVDLAGLHTMNAIIQTCWWICFLMCLFKDPSAVSCTKENYDAQLDAIGNAVNNDDLPSLCHTCRVRRPLRSKHCKFAKYCINKFDHFCPFVGNAVGRDNYVYFVSLLWCHMIAGGMWLVTVGYLYRRTTISWWLFFFAIYSVGWMFMLMGLLQYHMYLLSVNFTTNEHIGQSKYAYLRNENNMMDNPFDKKSAWKNILDGLFPRSVQFFSRDEVLRFGADGREFREDKLALLV